ncbi:MAG: hypothetical protein ACOYEK_08215 [bacterium]
MVVVGASLVMRDLSIRRSAKRGGDLQQPVAIKRAAESCPYEKCDG